MTQEEIMDMARESGMPINNIAMLTVGRLETGIELLERFAALVAAKEREACAAVAEKTVCDTHIPTGIKIYGARAAKAIRARGKQ